MDRWQPVTAFGVLGFVLLLIAIALFFLSAFGRSREVPARYRLFAFFLALFLIAAGFFVLLTRARESGNWPWGVIAVWCLLSGSYVLVKLVVGRLRRRSLGKNAQRA
jgi:uncharacterized membrane protein